MSEAAGQPSVSVRRGLPYAVQSATGAVAFVGSRGLVGTGTGTGTSSGCQHQLTVGPAARESTVAIFENVVTKLERADALDPPAEAVRSVLNRVMVPPVANALSGTWLGHPVHPLLVTAPIGAWLSAGFLDVTKGDPVAARRLVGFGVLCAAGSAATGWSDWRKTTGPAARVGLVHAVCNGTAVALYAGSWRARASGRERLGRRLAFAGAIFLSAGGFLGGHLAYALGVNVRPAARVAERVDA